MVGLVIGVLLLTLVCLATAHYQVWQEYDALRERAAAGGEQTNQLTDTIEGLTNRLKESDDALATVRKSRLTAVRERDDALHELAGLKEVNAAQLVQLVEADQKSMKLRNALKKLKAYCESWEGA